MALEKRFLDLSPTNSEGLHIDRPAYVRKWSKLENLIFGSEGALRSRPGFAKLAGTLPNTVAPGPPNLIAEVPNPRSTNTSGGRTVAFVQLILPTGPGTWAPTESFIPVGAATNWEALDDNPPDNFATKSRISLDGTTAGDDVYTAHTAISADFVTIDKVVLTGRARITGGSSNVTFSVGLWSNIDNDSAVGPWPKTGQVPIFSRSFTASPADVVDFAVIATEGDPTPAGDDAGAALVPFTVALLNGTNSDFFLAVTNNATAAGEFFELDYLRMYVTGHRTQTGVTTGLIGTSKVVMSPGSLLEWNDSSNYTDRLGTAVLPTAVPLDGAILYGQLYAVNGQDQTYIFPNAAGNFFQLSGKPTGQTVAAFAGRILYGWATDAAGNTIPERVHYSEKGNGQSYGVPLGAGFFDLLATPGGVVKLETFSDDVCMAYKGKNGRGVWTIRRTGDEQVPFVPDVIDFETSCVAAKTVKTTLAADGTPVQLFLGRNPLNGLSAYRNDGSTVVDVGAGLDLSDANVPRLGYSFAEVDPESGNYWLFVAEGTDAYPKRAWIMDMESHEWTSAALGFPYSAAGRWTLTTITNAPTGENKLVLGKATDNLIYKADYTSVVDAVAHTDLGETAATEVITIETGDHRLSGEAQTQAIAYRMHLMYTAAGNYTADVSVSTDGGITFNAAQSETLTGAATVEQRYAVLDPIAAEGRRLRFKLVLTPASATATLEALPEMWIEAVPTGDNA